MPKFLKYALIAVAVLFGLLLAAVGFIAATFDPNDYKPHVIRLVQEKKQRALTIPGEIKLTFFPRLGADLGQVTLSERNSAAPFASIERARVSLALWPLLSRQVVVDQVQVDGMQANLRRNRDGSTNFDDLLADEKSEEQVQFDIEGVRMTDARIAFDDQKERRKIMLSGLNLESTRIASGVPGKLSFSAHVKASQPAMDANIVVKTGFRFDLDQNHFILSGADADLKGGLVDFAEVALRFSGDADLRPNAKRFILDGIKFAASGKRAAQAIELSFALPSLAVTDAKVSGGKLTGEAKLKDGARNITAAFAAPAFEGSPQAFKAAAITADIALNDAGLNAKAKLAGALNGDIDKLLFSSPQMKLAFSGSHGGTALDGTVTTPLSLNLRNRSLGLSAIQAALTLPNPGGGSLKLAAAGNATLDFGKEILNTNLKGKLDDSSFEAKLGMTRFSPAALNFDIDIDKIDADRYQRQGAASAAKSGVGADSAPIDLSALRGVQARGALRIGSVKFNNIRAANLRAGVHANGSQLDINPLSANLYGGSSSGMVSATASAAPRFTFKQELSGIEVGALLQDAIGKKPIDGRGNVSLDVTSAGGGFTQIKKSVNGTARLALRDGAVHGINVAQAIRNAKAKVGELRGAEPPQAGTASTTEKTDFSELTGGFRITNGVARNDDLDVKSPLLRVGGAGDIDLGNERIDYLAKVTVVSTLQGQGGPELQALKGLTVPVRLSGPFTAIGWRIDFQGLVKELAKGRIEQKREKVKERAQEAVKEEKDKLREQLKEQFKGLLRK